jgi:hypothetical protein
VLNFLLLLFDYLAGTFLDWLVLLQDALGVGIGQDLPMAKPRRLQLLLLLELSQLLHLLLLEVFHPVEECLGLYTFFTLDLPQSFLQLMGQLVIGILGLNRVAFIQWLSSNRTFMQRRLIILLAIFVFIYDWDSRTL